MPLERGPSSATVCPVIVRFDRTEFPFAGGYSQPRLPIIVNRGPGAPMSVTSPDRLPTRTLGDSCDSRCLVSRLSCSCVWFKPDAAVTTPRPVQARREAREARGAVPRATVAIQAWGAPARLAAGAIPAAARQAVGEPPAAAANRTAGVTRLRSTVGPQARAAAAAHKLGLVAVAVRLHRWFW